MRVRAPPRAPSQPAETSGSTPAQPCVARPLYPGHVDLRRLAVRSSNPVLTRLNPSSYQRGYAPPSSSGASYPSPVMPVATDRMTVDDVVVRTVGLLAVTVVSGALAWAIVPLKDTVTVWVVAMLIGLVLG